MKSIFCIGVLLLQSRLFLQVSAQLYWKLRTVSADPDCSRTCGSDQFITDLTLYDRGSPYTPYACGVNDSTFGDYHTGTQVGSLFSFGNVVSCWVYSAGPSGPVATPHSDWYCLCKTVSTTFKSVAGDDSQDCSTTCLNANSYTAISACQNPRKQAACYDGEQYTFGYQNASSASSDHSCLAVNKPAYSSGNAEATAASSFYCLCTTLAEASAGLEAGCTTQGFSATSATPAAATTNFTTGGGGSGGQKISPGAIAGIVVGAAAVILIAGAAYFVIRSRRRKGSAHHTESGVRPHGKPQNYFAEPQVRLDFDQKSSGVSPSELLDFDLAVANAKTGPQSNAATDTKASSSVTSSSATSSQLNVFSVNFADIQDRFGAKSANLPTPGREREFANEPVVHGIQSISLAQAPVWEEDDIDSLSDTWKIKPQDLQCRMFNGRPIILGRGGYGKVYLGVLHREEVAIKVAISHNDVQLGHFIKEIRTLRACTNPNIVQFIGACVREKHAFMVMEYMPGRNLMTRLQEDINGDFAWYKRGRQIALDIAKGLIYLHSKKIAHLDLKSPNVMLAADGRGKIGDVGLGKLLGGRAAMTTLQGSWEWASPEQLNGQACGTASDIFAFGTVLWEICSHELPKNRSLRPLNVPKEAPAQIVSLIDICHRPDMKDRPTATTVHDLLIETMRS